MDRLRKTLTTAIVGLLLLCVCLAIASKPGSSPTPTATTDGSAPPATATRTARPSNTPRPTNTQRPSTAPAATQTPRVLPSPTATRLAQATATAAPAVIGTLYVSADGDGVFIRRTKNMDDKIKVWPDGTAMGLLVQDGEWCQVRDPDGVIGYIPAQYLAVAMPTAIPVRVATIPLTPPTAVVVQPSPTARCPAGAMAKCKDGSWSYSQTRSGTCSQHGGVSFWCP